MREEDLIAAYKVVFNSPNGELILNDLMNETTFYNARYTNPNETMYNEGARSVVLRILKMINVDTIRLKAMIKADAEASQEY